MKNKTKNSVNKNRRQHIDLKKFAWDYPENKITQQMALNSPELISRILKFGNVNDWTWLLHKIKKKGIKQFLKQYSYKLDDRTFNWWRIYCGFDNSFQKTERPVGHFEKIGPVK